MKNELIAYRDRLQEKIDAVNVVLTDLENGSVPARSTPVKLKAVKGPRMTAAAKAKISAAKKAWWKEKRKQT